MSASAMRLQAAAGLQIANGKVLIWRRSFNTTG